MSALADVMKRDGNGEPLAEALRTLRGTWFPPNEQDDESPSPTFRHVHLIDTRFYAASATGSHPAPDAVAGPPRPDGRLDDGRAHGGTVASMTIVDMSTKNWITYGATGRADDGHRRPGVNQGKGRGITKPPARKRRHRHR